jgi:Uma2 family endonuclease
MTDVMDLPGTTDEFDLPDPEALLESLDLPAGFKAEIIEREVVVTPAPGFQHESYFARLSHQLNVNGWSVSGNLGVLTPLGRFIPDMTVVALDYWERDSDEGWQRPDGIAMVVEITSTNPSNDRDSKRRGYAGAGIPLYLLIDRQRKESVLFSEPEKGDYATRARRPLGEPIPLPRPFSFVLEDIR